MVKITIDSKIRLKINDVQPDLIQFLKQALEIPNLEREKAQKLGTWGWQRLPEKIRLWEVHGEYLIMPRGFLKDLTEGFSELQMNYELIDLRADLEHGVTIGQKLVLRPWQEPQVEAMLYEQQGIVKAPAGSGKTVSVLAAAAQTGCRTLVIVNTKDIMWQWQERITTFLGGHFEIGQIGDNVFDPQEVITVATAQTLHSRYDELLDAGFFDSWGFVCLDECHHATAETYNRLMDTFTAKYRIGVSATPDKTGSFPFATRVLGQIIHTTKPSSVDALQRPEVVRVTTRFGFDFRSGHGRWGRSNYAQLLQALIDDQERNKAIVENICRNQGHHQLVISKRLGHLQKISDGLKRRRFPDPVVTIIGENDAEHRREAKKLAESQPCVVLSTLADEALDIPRLDRLHLIFPQRNTGLVIQQVGRVERTHSEKQNAIIYDYADMNVGPLESQYRGRRFEVYEPRGYTISSMHVKELL